MARVEFHNVVKRFGDVEAIRDMNLTIEDGEFVALLGPSGCGKSTSLFMLAGIYLPSSGELLFDDRVVNEVEAKDRNIGIVFQSYALYPHMTVRDNVLFPLRFKRIPREEALGRVRAAADLVQASCRAASSSGWRSRAPWSRSPSSCFSTSRSPIWTRRSG